MQTRQNKLTPVHYWTVNLLLLCTAIMLVCGLIMPLITFKQLIFFTNTFSIISGVRALFTQHQYFLFVVVLFFSIIIPILKFSLLIFNWNFPADSQWHWRNRLLRFSAAIGRWSMLDVFAVALFVVMMKIDLISEVQTHNGLRVFTGAVLSLMCLNAYINHVLLKTALPQQR